MKLCGECAWVGPGPCPECWSNTEQAGSPDTSWTSAEQRQHPSADVHEFRFRDVRGLAPPGDGWYLVGMVEAGCLWARTKRDS